MAGSSSCGVWCVEWMGGWMESGNKYNHSVGHLSRPVLVLVSVLVFVSVVIVSVFIASVDVSVVEWSDHGLHGVHWVKFGCGFVQLVAPSENSSQMATLLTSQDDRSWSKTVPFLNMKLISVTLDTSHALMS